MKWILPSTPPIYFERSSCGRFTVCRVNDGEDAIYEAWQGRERLMEARAPATDVDARMAARAKCKAHCERVANV